MNYWIVDAGGSFTKDNGCELLHSQIIHNQPAVPESHSSQLDTPAASLPLGGIEYNVHGRQPPHSASLCLCEMLTCSHVHVT